MNICKNCGNEYEDTYCPKCGVKFDLLRVCKSCGTAFSGKYCPECGERFLPLQTCANCGNRFVGRFCPECGTEYVPINSSMDSGDVTLSGYGAENSGVDVVPTSLLGYDEMSFEEKEKNVLGYVGSLIERGLFKEAAKWLDEIEKEEIALRGKVSAAIYYYKIFCENMTSSPDEVAEKYTEAGIDLKNNTNFILAMSSDDSLEKTKIIELDKKVEGVLRDRELYRQAEEKRKKDEEERKAREQREAAERLERERREAFENQRRKEIEANTKRKASTGLKYTKNGSEYTVYGLGSCTDADIVIPAEHGGGTVVGIEEFAFEDEEQIVSVVLPDTITSIGDSAFSGCKNLKSINIPKGIKEINDSVFMDCKSLESVDIPCGVKVICESAFESCESLSFVKLPSDLETISDIAFMGCTALERLIIPDSVFSIEAGAFEYSALTEIVFPKAVKSVEEGVFNDCENLNTVYYTGSKREWTNISIDVENDSFMDAKVYFYSESRPSERGNFWHWDEKGNPVPW